VEIRRNKAKEKVGRLMTRRWLGCLEGGDKEENRVAILQNCDRKANYVYILNGRDRDKSMSDLGIYAEG
jgi:hypothetical protein